MYYREMLRCIFCTLLASLLFVTVMSLESAIPQDSETPITPIPAEPSAPTPAPAAAEPTNTSTPAAATPTGQKEVRTRVIYKEKSYYEFEDTLIRGDREGPGGLNVFRKDRVKFKSQLNLSRSFIPELKASASQAD